MPEQFRRQYEESLEQWIERRRSDLATSLWAVDPVTGASVDVSVTSYADDVKEINMTTSASDAAQTIARSGVLLDQAIAHSTLGQNTSKAEHIASFMGNRQNANTKEVTQLFEEHGLGTVLSSARYLGAWPTFNGSTKIVIEKRVRSAKESYYGMGTRAWRGHISLKTRKLAFKNLVLNTLLSGLEAEVLRKCDYETLEKTLMALARRAIGRAGTYEHASGNRQRPSQWVRKYLAVSSCLVTLRTRRLGWLRDMLLHPGENVQVRAALGGDMRIPFAGSTSEHTPWLEQMMEDLLWLADRIGRDHHTIHDLRMRHGASTLGRWKEEGTLVYMLAP